MSTAGWKLVWLGLEVGDLGDLVIVLEIKKHGPGCGPSHPVISVRLAAC